MFLKYLLKKLFDVFVEIAVNKNKNSSRINGCKNEGINIRKILRLFFEIFWGNLGWISNKISKKCHTKTASEDTWSNFGKKKLQAKSERNLGKIIGASLNFPEVIFQKLNHLHSADSSIDCFKILFSRSLLYSLVGPYDTS